MGTYSFSLLARDMTVRSGLTSRSLLRRSDSQRSLTKRQVYDDVEIVGGNIGEKQLKLFGLLADRLLRAKQTR